MQVKIVISGCDTPNGNVTLEIMLYWDKIIPHIPRDHSTEWKVEGLMRSTADQPSDIYMRILVFLQIFWSKITSLPASTVTVGI